MAIQYLNTPVGWLKIEADEAAISAVTFVDETKAKSSPNELTKEAASQLKEYFEGSRSSFNLPLSPSGTKFEKSVWQKLSDIPFGVTTTYGKLAHKLNDPNLMRAVGRANGQNPISVIIPCHRVIGADNKLVGYAGGLHRKEWLLRHEGTLLL